MKKLVLVDEEIEAIGKLMPLLRKLQQEFRGLSFLKPEYREAKYAEVFQDKGAELLNDVAFIRYLEVEIGMRKHEG